MRFLGLHFLGPLAVLPLVCWAWLPTGLAAQTSPSLQQSLDAVRTAADLPGLAVAWQSPTAFGTAASGLAKVESGIALTPDARFAVGSLTKTFVAAAALQLASEGVLDLDHTVASWLPGLLPDGDRIRIRHLLSHTSGLFNFTDDVDFVRQSILQPETALAPRQIVARTATRPLDFDPGTGWNYSNTGYLVLGMVLEEAAGAPLRQVLERRFIGPLGLQQTHFIDPDTPLPGMAQGYTNFAGFLGAEAIAYTPDLGRAGAAGGMVSCAADIARWAAALYGGQVLGPEATDAMLTFGPADYGFGAARYTTPLGPAVGHNGAVFGFVSAVVFLPEHRLAVAVLANGDGDPGTVRDDFLQRLAPLLPQLTATAVAPASWGQIKEAIAK